MNELCDEVAVLRSGSLVGKMDPPFDNDQLISLMFGKLILKAERQTLETGKPVIELKHLELEDYRMKMNPIDIRYLRGRNYRTGGDGGQWPNPIFTSLRRFDAPCRWPSKRPE